MNFEFKSVEEIQEQGSGNYGKFGKNSNAVLTQFEYVEGEYGPSINITFEVMDGKYKKFINPVTKAYAKAGGEIQPGHPEYDSYKKAAEARLSLYVNQIAEAITNQQTVKDTLSATPPTDVISYFKLMERVVKSNPNWNTKPLDLFLQYQYTPRPGVNRTYLEIPKPDNLKNGNLIFVVASQGEGYTEAVSDRGLTYVNTEGTVHPFKRTAYWMNQAYAKMTSTTEAPRSAAASQFNTTNSSTPSSTVGENW